MNRLTINLNYLAKQDLDMHVLAIIKYENKKCREHFSTTPMYRSNLYKNT